MRFTDSYGEQSCTAGRSSFITGQSVYRTGLSKVGIPGSPIGLSPKDPTIAALLKPLGYATGPKLFNLRTDPFERADITSNTYFQLILENAYLVFAGTTLITEFLETFKEFPPRQEAASFTIDQALAKMEAAMAGG